METPPTHARPHAARTGRRVAEGVLLLVAIWFGASSTWQITVSALVSPPPESAP